MNQNKELAVSLNQINLSFDQKTPVLNHLSLDVLQGERLSILGPGGCGKSSLLKVILGLLTPQSGQISLFGRLVSSLSAQEHAEQLRCVGMAFQQGALFDFMTVRENILFAMENMTSIPKSEQEDRVHSFLKQVNLADAHNKLPSELSGGMRRRVGIVRAMIIQPKLALLDEPTAGLDPVTTTLVIDMIHRIGDHVKASLVCVTSSTDVAFRFAKKIAILKDGQIIALGSKEELLSLNNPWIDRFLTLRNQHDI